MQRSKYLIFFLLTTFYRLTFAQDTGNFTQFFFNPYSLNPSFAGIDGRSALFLAYRKQWSGIEGSPTIANFSFHAPLKSGLSLGFNVANDKRGLLSNSGLLITMAYSVQLGESSYIRFGLSGGGSWNTVDLNKINPGSDPALINLLNQNASVIGNAGLSLHLKSFHIGASLPNLLSPAYVSEDAFTITEVKPFESIVIHASNRFYFADNKHVFEPYALYRINTGLPSQYEFAGVLHLNHVVWLGGSYKQEFGISGFGGIKVNNKFALGGSYTLKNTGENELSFPTYEVHLSILGGASKSKSKSKAKTHLPPTYSFVHTELPKKTRAQEFNDKYNAAIAKADKALAAKNYEESRLDYYEALKYKPNESYPKTKIAEIDKIISYEAKIKTANSEFAAKNYNQALTNYEAASNLKPTEQYPKDKIAEIKALLAASQSATNDDRKYMEALARADKALTSKNYEEAKLAYNEALRLKPSENYPKNQIKEAEKGIAYQAGIKKADGEFTAKSYEQALADYEEASRLYPDEQYPKDKIAEIKGLIATRDMTDQNTLTKWVATKETEPTERHETVKRGTNALELKSGNYVIVGVFGSMANARGLARKLVDTGFNANYGFLTEKNLWYVHVFEGNHINETRSERDKFRKMPIFRNAWLLTVQN